MLLECFLLIFLYIVEQSFYHDLQNSFSTLTHLTISTVYFSFTNHHLAKSITEELFNRLLSESEKLNYELPLKSSMNLDLVLNPLTCSACAVLFCSAECQTAAHQQYHNLLCGFNTEFLDELDNRDLYTLLLRICAGIANATWQSKKFLDEFSGPSFESFFKENKEDAGEEVRNLAHQFETLFKNKRPAVTWEQSFVRPQELFQPLFFQELLGKIQSNATNVEIYHPLEKYISLLTNSNLSSVPHLLPRISQISQILKKPNFGFPRSSGLGVYPQHHFLNHDCAPNCSNLVTSWKSGLIDTKIRISALCDIEPEEELTISYLDDPEELPQYFCFTCSCSRCLSESGNKN